MPNFKPHLSKRILIRVNDRDYDYLVHELCAGKHNVFQEIMVKLFTDFTKLVRDRKLPYYPQDHNTPLHILRLLHNTTVKLQQNTDEQS